MSLNTILKKTITDYTDLDKIYRSVTSEKYYKIGTIDRGLRHLAEQGIIRPVFQNNYIIAYKPLLEDKTQPEPIFKQPEPTQKQSYLIEPRRITH